MARKFTQVIQGSQCIGDSLSVINDNFANLDTSATSLSSSTVSLNNLRLSPVQNGTPSGTLKAIPVLDTNGTVQGYIPLYNQLV